MRTGTLSLGAVCRAVLKLKEAEKQKKSPMLACSEPSYNQIYLAYSRCFVYSGDGHYYVGNHRLCDTFSPARAITTLTLSKENGYHLPIRTCKSISGGGYVLFIYTSGEVLNRNIPSRDVQQTAQNFASELEREYQRHLKDVLAEAES